MIKEKDNLKLVHSNSIKKRYIFVESGACLGNTIGLFTKTQLYSKYPWEIYAFEPNPNLIPRIPKRMNQTILNKAVWIHDGFVKFYLGNHISSSILKHKKTGKLKVNEPIKVESINFGQWLKRNFQLEDFILVSLDIEGAEYKVLNSMLCDDTIKYIDKLYVDFHNVKVGIPKKADKKLISEIKKRNIFVESFPVESAVKKDLGYISDKTVTGKLYLRIDAAIGRIGIFLQKNYPYLYLKLKNIKGSLRKK